MRIVAGDPAALPAVAYAIGRPIGGAVVRNRLRRRLREVVSVHRELLEPGASYLFGAEVGAVTTAPADLDHAVVALLRRGADTLRTGSTRR